MSVLLEHDLGTNQAANSRDERIQSILNEVRAQRAAGREVTDEQIVAQHADLLPELSAALVLLKKIQVRFQQVIPLEGSESRIAKFLDSQVELSAFGSVLPGIAGYRLVQPIERGGQGVVFLAIQQSTNRRVAVKVLDGGAFVTARKQDRFEREVKALVALDHPGIVRIVDRGRTADGSFFIAMDYVDGEDLNDYLKRRRVEGWNTRQIAELFAKIAEAIGEAHRLGIVHRDIKPSNVRIDPRGEPRILDFGLARLTAAADEENPGLTVTQTGGVVGSLPWASPEQASGDSAKICPASDVYSLGVAFYRALTGSSPYDLYGTLRMQMHKICEVKPAFPTKRATPLPFGPVDPLLAGVILKCLEKQPARRYADGVDLALELQEYLAGRLREVSRKNIRRRSIALVTFAVMVCVTAALTVSFHHTQAATVVASKLPGMKNSLGMELVLIPAGTFRAGSPSFEDGHDPNEELHQVTLTRPYYMGCSDVTRGEYRRVMGSLPADIGTVPGEDQLPVDSVSRDDAEEFCRRLNRMEGGHYRLPTEAEWEYACRAGTDTPFSGSGRVDEIAWYTGNSGGRIHPVGLKQANNWGIYDMEGNVSQWCADRFVSHVDSNSVIDPFTHPERGALGVVRGGSYLLKSLSCRAAARMEWDPNSHMKGTGFRVVMDVDQPADARGHL